MTLTALALTAAVRDRARDLGFDRVAIGPAAPAVHGPAFERWLDAGYAGEMAYMERTRHQRLDPARLLPGARSVVAVAMLYAPAERSESTGGRIARYAGGRDYHDVMRPRLNSLARFIEAAAGRDTQSRAAVDTSAVLERDLAAAAGLGWIGKNTNLIDPDLGSYFFIGIVLTTAELESDVAQPDRCGTCRACLDACPTQAFVGAYTLDARRCISYLTIEHRGSVDAELRPGIGDWLFGCDVCQEVCPWNRKAPPARDPALTPGEPPSAAMLLGLDEEKFRARFRGSALSRAKRSGLRRNAAIVLGNSGDQSARHDLVGAAHDPDPVVAAAAAWALEKLQP
jgi:epoxyqueuosine reductase